MLGIDKSKLIFIEHHSVMLITQYVMKKKLNEEKVDFYNMNGSGDRGINATVSLLKNRKIKRIFETKSFIIGRIYRHITLILGMKWGEHEYKVMELAALFIKFFTQMAHMKYSMTR